MLRRLWRSSRAGPDIRVGVGCLVPIATLLGVVAAIAGRR
jgi:hypothetical protein